MPVKTDLFLDYFLLSNAELEGDFEKASRVIYI